jgi:predicted ATP-dependent endonuclease of OLD family
VGWRRQFTGHEQAGIDAASIARLFTNIADKDLWSELLDLQLIDRPDILTIKFRKPEEYRYTAIEELAHGQRCTAILVALLADGATPVLVDQPEDALHAPWIEEYLVDRLRSLGSRQYVFATRSPGIVISADAEQIVTMRATAGRGECEAAGSLERHDLNYAGPASLGGRTGAVQTTNSQA